MADPPRIGAATPAESRFLARVLTATTTLLDVHVKFARREAAEDFARLALAVVLLVAAFVFTVLGITAAEIALAIALRDARELSWQATAGVLAALNAALVALSVLWARARLKQPLLRETRDLLVKTASAFTGHGAP